MAQPTPVVMEVSTGGMDVGTEQEKKAGEEGNQTNSGVVHIAVEGCSHGNLDEIYASVTALQDTHDTHVDLLIICGDFQAVRNQADLECLACPPKYRHMQGFHEYYSGKKVAPVLTIFVGGNHEASNHLQELYHGGWVAPNIYFMGFAGVVKFRGLRIAGLSGIFKPRDYTTGYHELPPYDRGTMRSVFHVREFEVERLSQLSGPIDIMVSHDWPRGVYHYGNVANLLRMKPFFTEEVRTNTLGSTAGAILMDRLRPAYWFSAHLHVKFAAVVPHEAPHHGRAHATRFLALDKCLPRRDFLQVLRVPVRSSTDTASISTDKVSGSTAPVASRLCFDAEWLAILRAKIEQLAYQRNKRVAVSAVRPTAAQVEAALGMVKQRHGSDAVGNDVPIPLNFQVTAPTHQHGVRLPPAVRTGNPQTDELLACLGLRHHLTIPYHHHAVPATPSAAAASGAAATNPVGSVAADVVDSNEIALSDSDDADDPTNGGGSAGAGSAGGGGNDTSSAAATDAEVSDPAAIDIDDL